MAKGERRARARERERERRKEREALLVPREPGPTDWRLISLGGLILAAGVALLAWDRPYPWGLAAMGLLFLAAGLLTKGLTPPAKTVIDWKARKWAAGACFLLAGASLVGYGYHDATTEGFEVKVAEKQVLDRGNLQLYFEYSVKDANGTWREVPTWVWHEVEANQTVRCTNRFDLVPMTCEVH